MERTLALIKPDAVCRGLTGQILNVIELNGFKVVELKQVLFTKAMAEQFYAVHSARPFFGELVEMICASPVVAMILERENAIESWRLLMGATNPAQATVGTIRRMFGQSIGSNSVHGSDSLDSFNNEKKVVFGSGCC